jgi:TPR repeat protein
MWRVLVALAFLIAPAVAADPEAEQLWQRSDALLKQGQYQQALPLLIDAAERGHPRAQATLGNLYAGDTEGHSKHGIPYDMDKSMYWYAKAAAQGHRFAEYGLGNGYMLGLGGLPVDQVKASQLFDSSARKGLVDAQEAIAMSWELGRKARRLFRRWLCQDPGEPAHADLSHHQRYARFLRRRLFLLLARPLPEAAWSRPLQPQHGDLGARPAQLAR